MKRNRIVKNRIAGMINPIQYVFAIFCVSVIFLVSTLTLAAQELLSGNSHPEKRENGNKADKNLRSLAKVNPSTLALEMYLPLMSYPGRNGNSLSVDFRYSSKVWRLKDMTTWFNGNGSTRMFMTDVYPLYAERSAGGWTSSLVPPRIDEEQIIYNQSGSPYAASIGDAELSNMYEIAMFQGSSHSDPYYECTFYFDTPTSGTYECVGVWEWEQPVGGQPVPSGGEPNSIFYVKRWRVVMPDGSSHEFRQNDGGNPLSAGTFQSPTPVNLDGEFLAVDGSGMTLNRDANGFVLRLPNGGYYDFPSEAQNEDGLFATSFTDVHGNRMTYHEPENSPGHEQIWTDTLGRQIKDPIPHNWLAQTQQRGTQQVNLPGLNGTPQQYQIIWDNLKPRGCESSNDPGCNGTGDIFGGALEDQSESLYFSAPFHCMGNLATPVATPYGPDGTLEVLFPLNAQGVRPCNEFAIVDQPDSNPNITVPVRFNPVVLTKLALPNGQAYEFKYNRYGEISKITYPTGSFETFVYDDIRETSGFSTSAHAQTNRGVVERKVYDANGTLEQRWTYTPTIAGTVLEPSIKITTIQSQSDNVAAPGMKTETLIYERKGDLFGYSDPLAGMPFDEKTYDESGALRSRALTEYVTKDIPTARIGLTAKRDLRVKRKVSIMFEPDSGHALATLSETEYDDSGASDLAYFSHLNVKQQKSYHYGAVLDSVARSDSLTWATVASWFPANKLASVTETDYLYRSDYKERGITSLPIETRVLDPANQSNVLARTQTEYDESAFFVADSPDLIIGDFEPTWINPLTDQSIPTNSRALRGNPTTSKVQDKDNNNTWIQKHTQYDQYGNVRKVWEVNENPATSSRFVETQYSGGYACAYPTKVIAPAPNTNVSTHGTNETSTVETAYDFNTGLPIAVKDDFGQITTTEYDDALLRPTKVSPVVVNGVATGPITMTEYKDGEQRVIVHKQLDATNWDSAMTYMDSFGRAVKTVAKDSQGDVIVETKYDLLGRVQMVSNPYRQGDTVLWSFTEYDAAGRVKKTYEPAEYSSTANPTPNGNSLGETSYGISTVTDFVGTVVTSKDASGRRSRSITNALGQLIRVDEPVGFGGTADEDLGTLADPAQATFYKYDAYGKMVKVTQEQQERFFKYDSLGRLIRVRQPEQEVNVALNLNDPTTGNDQWTAGFTYDVMGNVLTAIDANGTVITNTYDRAGRVITRSYNDTTTSGFVTTPSVNFYYDGKGLAQQQTPNFAKGKLTKVDNGVSATEYMTFDNFGRLTRSRQITDGVVYGTDTAPMTYSYNLSGALIEEKYPSGRVVKNEFESDGDLARIMSKRGNEPILRPFASGFAYTPDGKIEKLRLGNGLWEAASFNNRLQVTELRLGHSAASGNLWKLGYEYGELDENGEVIASTNTGNIGKQTLGVPGVTFVQRYRYDSLYRLTSAKETADETETWSQEFQYDRYGNRTGLGEVINGNRTARNAPGIDPETNRFIDLETFNYDKNGNIVRDKDVATDQSRTFIFNGDNKQAEIRDVNGIVIGKYFYDGEGNRVKKFIFATNETTVFVYSSGKLVAEYSTALPPANPSINYTVTDMLGSPRVITNELANVVSRRDFMPFGEDVPVEAGNRAEVVDVNAIAVVDGSGNLRTTALNYQSTDAIRQRFTGYQKDTETSLDFAEARMYESRYGRFTAVDPLLASGKSADPQTFNRYAYVTNNPLLFTDPDGLQTGFAKGDVYINKSRTQVRIFLDGKVRKGFDRLTGNISTTTRVGKVVHRMEVTPNGWAVGDRVDNLKFPDQPVKPATRVEPSLHAEALVEDLGTRAPGAMKMIGALAGGGIIGGLSAAPAAGAGGLLFAGTVVSEALLADQTIRQTAEAGHQAAMMGSLEADRKYAVEQAWKQEAEMVRKTGEGSQPWTPAEKQQLLETGKVQGYEGHHTNSVNGHPEQARDPSNVQFAKGRSAHLELHNGNWRNQTEGPLIPRRLR